MDCDGLFALQNIFFTYGKILLAETRKVGLVIAVST